MIEAFAKQSAGDRGPVRLVVLCQTFYPETHATSQLFTALFRQLAGPDFGVRVLCGFPSGAGADRSGPRREQLGQIRIERCGIRLDTKRNLPLRAVAYASFLAHAAFKLARLRKPGLVVGVTNPPFNAILLWALARVKRFPYQYVLLDLYPEGLIALGKLGARAPVTRIWGALNRRAYTRAERLLVLGRDSRRLIQQRYRVAPARVRHTPHWSPSEITRPRTFSESKLPADLGLSEKFVVQYSGNMGLWHDIETIVHAADALRSEHRIHFLFIGDGIRRPAAERLARSLALPNVTWHDYVPLAALPDSLACCHVALISLRSGLEGVAVPSKLYGILASGRPVVAQVPSESEVAYVVGEEECGRVVEPGAVDELAGAIRTLASEPETAQGMGERAFAAYQSKYTLDRAVDRFSELWSVPRDRRPRRGSGRTPSPTIRGCPR